MSIFIFIFIFIVIFMLQVKSISQARPQAPPDSELLPCTYEGTFEPPLMALPHFPQYGLSLSKFFTYFFDIFDVAEIIDCKI